MIHEADEIEYYKDRNGTVPFNEWINGLRDIKGRAAVRIRLGRVFRGLLGDCKSLGFELYELRIQYGPGYRVYFGRCQNKIVILTAGHKGTQKRDIEKARTYWDDYRG